MQGLWQWPRLLVADWSRAYMDADVRESHGPAVVLIVTDQPVLAEVVRLALNHGQFTAQVAANAEEAEASLAEGRPHFAVVDADLSNGAILDLLVGASGWTDPLPILALTRRGDLRTKLAAFDRG